MGISFSTGLGYILNEEIYWLGDCFGIFEAGLSTANIGGGLLFCPF